MTFGSVCSGIEAASVAWEPLGWRCAFVAEIDPFARAVLAHRYPGVPNLGDFTGIQAAPEPIDLLVGGTPCQSFSVAGRRAGLDDPRGVLAFEFLRLAGRLLPRWVVFENVPGLLCTNGGRDFGAFLGALGQLGYGWAYRVLDARYFGVPQRRRRVFVVGHLGDWRRAAAVLLEPHGLSGHPAPGEQTEPRLAPSVTPGARRVSGARSGEQLTVANALRSSDGRRNGGPAQDGSDNIVIAHTLRADGFDASEDGTGRGTPLIVQENNQNGITIRDTAGSLRADAPGSQPCGSLVFQCHGSNVGPMGTVRSGNGNTAGGVPFVVNAAESCAKARHARPSETARCLDGNGSFASAQGGTVVAQPSAVRRLTPREAERLQGLPDNWTLVPYKNKPAADGPRYKAIGNSFAIPPVRWIGRRIGLMESVA